MNQNQKKYALGRIAGLCCIKQRDLETKYKIERVHLEDKERLELIYKGKVSLLPKDRINCYSTDLVDAFDFSKFERAESHKDGYEEKLSQIKRMAQSAEDQIMLGDCEEALKLINKLENYSIN